MKVIFKFAITLALCGCYQLVGQNAKSKTPQSIAVVDLHFKDDQPVGGLLASPVLVYPLECSLNGTLFVEMLNPPDFRQHVLYGVSPSKGAYRLDVSQITDLYDVRMVSHYAAPSLIAVLVYATRDGAEPRKGEHHYYIATFDKDGGYKKTVQVPDQLKPRRLGAFDDGVFLIFGVDDEKKPRLALLDADGAILRVLNAPAGFEKGYEAFMNSGSERGAPPPPMQMVPFRDTILVVPRSSRIPVLELRSSGATREVKLDVPKTADYMVDSFIPSPDKWYVRFNLVAPVGKAFSNEPLLYEVNPSSGKLLVQYHPVGALATEIACAPDDRFVALRRDDNGHFVKMKASAE